VPKNILFSFVLITWSIISLAQTQSQSGVVSFPIGKKYQEQLIIKKPALDLEKNGSVLDVGEATQLALNGEDLSLLNPKANKIWQNKKYEASDTELQNYPEGSIGVDFEQLESQTQNNRTMLVKVRSRSSTQAPLLLGVSVFAQTAMMRAALLRKLGFYLPSPKYYKNLKVYFKDEEEKSQFIKDADDSSVPLDTRPWILEDNKTEHYLTLSSAMLLESSSESFDFYWGLGFPESRINLLKRFSNFRAYRSLVIPLVLVDVPESINRFSIKPASINSGSIIIPYFMSESFQACTFDDAKWILRRINQLTNTDIQEIVELSGYPEELKPLVTAKIVARIKNISSVFNLVSNLTEVDLKSIQSANGIVTNGKVMVETVSGWPQRFSHGERKSPYEEGDFFRFLNVEGKTAIIDTVLGRLNEQLSILTAQDAAKNYQQDLIKKVIDHYRQNPNAPYAQKLTAWGGPLFGLNVNASRHVATGTYNGSTAPVQLVDQISVGANLGYFMSLDGVDKLFPAFGAQAGVTRDYTHVRPIESIKEGNQESWTNLFVPAFMKNIGKVLKDEKFKDDKGIEQNSLDYFLLKLKPGEVFTITDSIGVGAYAQVSASIDGLFGLSPLSFLNSVTLGVDANRVVLKQVMIARTEQGIQVFIRKMKNVGYGLEFNANFYVNILKLRAERISSDIHTEAFQIRYNPSESQNAVDGSEVDLSLKEKRHDLRIALKDLFINNNNEVLYKRFQDSLFVVDHELDSEKFKMKFLMWKFQKFYEDHTLNIQFPVDPAQPELNPKDEIVTLYRNRTGSMVGRDPLGFLFELIGGIFNNEKIKVSVPDISPDNPANIPFGKAYWRTITTETDISEKIEQQPSVAILQRVWGGWKLSPESFLDILDKAQNEFKNTSVGQRPLLDWNEFTQVKSVDFYRITANLSITSSGIEKIKKFLTQDRKQLYRTIITAIGEGNYDQGWSNYYEKCWRENANTGGKDPIFDPEHYYKKQYFTCLTQWMRSLFALGESLPTDKKEQAKWITRVLSLLDDNMSLKGVMIPLDESDFIFFVRINGFRPGDEDGDLEYFSNTIGDPNKDFITAGGLVSYYARKTGLLPVELDRTIGGFQ